MNSENLKDVALDLDIKQTNKKDMGKFLQKFQQKANVQDVRQGLGLIQQDVSLNELAAKGIQLSLKEKLATMIQEQSKVKQTTEINIQSE